MVFKKGAHLESAQARWLATWLLPVLGFILVGLLFHFPSGFPPNNGASPNPPAFFVGAIQGAISGLVVGTFQALLLRMYFSRVIWWVVATVTALSLTHALGDALPDPIALPLVQALGGVLLGSCYWLALRRCGALPAPWTLATAFAWFVGLTTGLAISNALGTDWQLAHIIAALTTGLVASFTTATLFFRLLRTFEPAAPP
jgi:hypothetical protein